MGSCASIPDKGADGVDGIQTTTHHPSTEAMNMSNNSTTEHDESNLSEDIDHANDLHSDEDQASPLTSPTLFGSPTCTTSPALHTAHSFSSRQLRTVDFEATVVRMSSVAALREDDFATLQDESLVPNDSFSQSSTYRSMDEQLVAHGEAMFVPTDFGCGNQCSSASSRRRACFRCQF